MARARYAVLLAVLVTALPLCSCFSKEPGRYYGDGYSLKFPEGWDVAEEDAWTTYAYSPVIAANDVFSEFLFVSIEEAPYTFSLEAYETNCIESVAEEPGITNFQLLDKGSAVLGDENSRWILYTMDIEGQTLKGLTYMVVEGKTAYTVSAVALPGTYDEFKPKFEEVINTFRLE
jgi:hypothetical protein